jgi:DNA-binding response OmpR family regulator
MSNHELTILIVDDVEENVVLIRRFLENEHYAVRTAPDGRGVTDALKNEKIDLVILDINLPFVDGITLLKDIRHNPQYEQVPVLMLTAMDDMKTTMECMRQGACGYITKPFSLKSLKQQVDTCLSQKQQATATGEPPESR